MNWLKKIEYIWILIVAISFVGLVFLVVSIKTQSPPKPLTIETTTETIRTIIKEEIRLDHKNTTRETSETIHNQLQRLLDTDQ